MIYPIHTPLIVQKMFPRFLWRFPSEKQKKIYLTFDDGPIPNITPWVLQQLEQYQAKATFFCVGANIEKNPSIYQQIKAQGHTIGNHTYQHLNGWKTNTKDYLADVQKCQNLTQTKLFRPPYGRLSPSQAKALNQDYTLVIWDVIAGDFDPNITGEQCRNNIVKNAVDGSIIVLHDSLKSWKRLEFVLPKILEYYTNLGFEFAAIS